MIGAFKIRHKGTTVFENSLVSLSLVDSKGRLNDRATIVVNERTITELGAKIEIAFGADDKNLVHHGTFALREIETSGDQTVSLTLFGMDTTTNFKKLPESKGWTDTTLGAVISSIAVKNDLVPSYSEDLGQTIIKEAQTDETDSSFLNRVISKYGASMKIHDGKLIAVQPGKDLVGCPTHQATAVVSYTHSYRDPKTFTGVKAFYWDKTQAKRIAIHFGDPTRELVIPATLDDLEEATRIAQSEFATLGASSASLTVTLAAAPGLDTANIAYGHYLEIDGIQLLAGRWTVKTITHKLGAEGLTATLECTLEIKK